MKLVEFTKIFLLGGLSICSFSTGLLRAELLSPGVESLQPEYNQSPAENEFLKSGRLSVILHLLLCVNHLSDV